MFCLCLYFEQNCPLAWLDGATWCEIRKISPNSHQKLRRIGAVGNFRVEAAANFGNLARALPKQHYRFNSMIKLVKIAALVATVSLVSITSVFATGDVDKGKKFFKKCKSCHMVGEGAKKKVGPVLNNIFGATAGTNEEFAKKYSKAMKAAGADGLVWTEETLTEFITNPKAMIKKTKMSYKGSKKPEDTANVIAYLATFSPDYTPEPEKTEN